MSSPFTLIGPRSVIVSPWVIRKNFALAWDGESKTYAAITAETCRPVRMAMGVILVLVREGNHAQQITGTNRQTQQHNSLQRASSMRLCCAELCFCVGRSVALLVLVRLRWILRVFLLRVLFLRAHHLVPGFGLF